MSSQPNFYRCLADDLLEHTIAKLERFVRSLDRNGTAKGIAEDYRRALDLARAERDRRVT